MKLKNLRLAVIGLGYVGLPLAVAFGKKRNVIGFDINRARIEEIKKGNDVTKEVDKIDLEQAKYLRFTSDPVDLCSANCFIVTVPTPIDQYKRPDLRHLIDASEMIGRILKPFDIVIYESTVYPGATEEHCLPILERVSGLKYIYDFPNGPSVQDGSFSRIQKENIDCLPNDPVAERGSAATKPLGFYLGYSPERINPGDKKHRFEVVKKVTSGSTREIAELIDSLYSEVVTAGTHMAESIRIAEAAKVIENTQRDLNIALVNELSIIFGRLGIDTQAVLNAAGTKWNFLPFRPGLVGGHCIGVDPYYLTFKAQAVGYNPEVILSGRRMNDGMGTYVASQLVKAMASRSIKIVGAHVLIMGLTFKENCPDLRNSRVIDVIGELVGYNQKVDVFDPWVDPDEAERYCGIRPVVIPSNHHYDAVVIAVAHEEFRKIGAAGIRAYMKKQCVIYDLKYILPRDCVDLRL